MSTKNPQVDAYLGKVKNWREETETLRALILRHPLAEELKWGKPCYTFRESNILIIQGFNDYCALMFCKGALLEDAKGLLQAPGENSQSGRQLRFTSAKEITMRKAILDAYIKEAIELEKSGREVVYKETSDYAVPEELTKKLEGSPSFRAAFEALTPGRQRGYLLHFAAAKQSATREARIEKCRPFIVKGLGLHEHWKDKPSLRAKESGGEAAPKLKKFKTVEDYLDARMSGAKPVLLSGGNPQIPKGDGEAPVRAYIEAMPGWKRGIGEHLDALVRRAVPKTSQAVRWNSPFYGVEGGEGWFMNVHVFTRYVRVTFFKGLSLQPIPPGGTERSGDARWFDIFENEPLDEKQMTAWIKQAAKLPGWAP